MNSTKILKYLVPLVVILLAVAFWGKKKGWFGGEMKYKVATEKVAKRNIIETITANGKIQPETEVKISPDVSGEIVELYVKEGDEVKKGDLLLEINPENFGKVAKLFGEIRYGEIGKVTDSGKLVIKSNNRNVVDAEIIDLKEAWQSPLRW